MDVAEPIRCVIPTLDAPVLEVVSRVTGPLTGREISRLVRRGSEAGVRRTLHRLAEQGVVHSEQHGSAVFYRLNRDHLAFPAVEILTDLRRELLDRLGRLFSGWDVQPMHASVFGSTARRDGGVDSDIDILLIRPADIDVDSEPWASQVDDLRERVYGWTGNRCQPYQLDPQDIADHVRMGAQIVEEWMRDAITLHGPGIASLVAPLRGERAPSSRSVGAAGTSR
jgi:DNA-binding transcriptional ArsR family regulator